MMTADLMKMIVPSEDLLPVALACKQTWIMCDSEEKRGGKTRWLTCATSTRSRLKWAVEHMGAKPTVEWCAFAAGRGDGDMMVHISWTWKLPLDSTVCNEAARGGQTDVLKYLRLMNTTWTQNVYYYAARCGHLHTLQWLYEVKAPPTNLSSSSMPPEWPAETVYLEFGHPTPSQGAIAGGHLHILEWMESAGHNIYHMFEENGESTMSFAIWVVNEIDVMEWLYKHMPSWMSGIWEYQALRSAILCLMNDDESEMLEWVLSKGVRVDCRMWEDLAVSTIKVAEWLAQRGVPFVWDTRIDVHVHIMELNGVDTDECAEECIECMEWVCARGYAPSQLAIDFASSHSDKCLQALLRMQTKMAPL